MLDGADRTLEENNHKLIRSLQGNIRGLEAKVKELEKENRLLLDGEIRAKDRVIQLEKLLEGFLEKMADAGIKGIEL